MTDKPGFTLDPETGLARECSAVVYAPRQHRSRFQANCVEVHANDAEAIAASDAVQYRFAARVVGPSKSSEGFMMYYLVRWLE